MLSCTSSHRGKHPTYLAVVHAHRWQGDMSWILVTLTAAVTEQEGCPAEEGGYDPGKWSCRTSNAACQSLTYSSHKLHGRLTDDALAMQERHSTGATHAQRGGGHQRPNQERLLPRAGHSSDPQPDGPLSSFVLQRLCVAGSCSHVKASSCRPEYGRC